MNGLFSYNQVIRGHLIRIAETLRRVFRPLARAEREFSHLQTPCSSAVWTSRITILIMFNLGRLQPVRQSEPLLSQAQHSETLKVLSSSVQPPPEYQHLARCAHCTYTFCNICKLPWHGREVCKFNFLYLKYKNGDAHTKVHLEASHRKELFEKLAEQEAANDMSLAWVHSQTKPCPRGHPVEKSGGCNKMVCSVCSIKFCWKCLKEIDGYEHFGKAGVCQLWVEDVMLANERGWVRA